MENSLTSEIGKDHYLPQKLKAFLSEPEGCSIVSSLEEQYQCSIMVVNDALNVTTLNNQQIDTHSIEALLRELWQKREVQTTIRLAALNASCTHLCYTILPRAYTAVVMYFAKDIQRRSRCTDIVIEYFEGKVSIFGCEATASMAREYMIAVLTDHFGNLEMEIPMARRATRDFCFQPFLQESIAPPVPSLSYESMFRSCEQNGMMTSSPPAQSRFEESLLGTNFERNHGFPMVGMNNGFHSYMTPSQRTNNVERSRIWIPSEDVCRVLGNRAALKKQVEAQFHCVITVRTDGIPHFGMTAVEIMGQNKEQCHGASEAILQLVARRKMDMSPMKNDSGFNSPSNMDCSITPEKRTQRRSNFRDQPKVLLALTPRKSPPVEQ